MSTSTPVKADSSFEKELLQTLQFSGLQKESLNELVRTVAGIHGRGLNRFRLFPIGIPAVTGLQVQTLLEKNQLPLLEKILLETPQAQGIVIFPYGIPFPDIFQVNLTIGPVTQAAITPAAAGAAAIQR
ncbi:MAG TPA: hypothetical protein VKZ53_13440 [Candidatus Angelobacter sp.]|nr:hypothetical protein [Candidatus Angelobacter sp.]